MWRLVANSSGVTEIVELTHTPSHDVVVRCEPRLRSHAILVGRLPCLARDGVLVPRFPTAAALETASFQELDPRLPELVVRGRWKFRARLEGDDETKRRTGTAHLLVVRMSEG